MTLVRALGWARKSTHERSQLGNHEKDRARIIVGLLWLKGGFMHDRCVIRRAILTSAVEALPIGFRYMPRGVPVQSGIGAGMTQPPDPASFVMDVLFPDRAPIDSDYH